MAELPEIERYRMVLSEQLNGKQITSVQINSEKSINMPVPRFTSELLGIRITGIRRRAKYLIIELSSGKYLLLHVMIGGWLFLGDDQVYPKPAKQVILSFGERKLFFVGLRLGYLHLLMAEELNGKLEGLGPEPFDLAFCYEDFQERISLKRGTLKSILVDPKFIAGIGSCYSDEICYQAKLRPTKKANELTGEQTQALYDAIRLVLTRAIEIGSYMDYPLYADDTKTGQYNNHFLVYACENQPCKRCGTVVEEVLISSRRSYLPGLPGVKILIFVV
ncbi:DNA-formamidopyrimidine glycosylase family protein [Bacillus sp. CECT 9360]|uniref:Fpg/Nei family DNA glycosylase n=1 Tax=Bacillus sp. CECT 9360 TaxID=2845821 RepID=UPI001E290C77|nr:DNA-formamidopyrimidine glycosylase family protein [Bacillus sp. CECT 9360]CAH0347465.1 Formamidopyrimidine-DNA glycosylase [Bacillus sp. CECT 9360]